MDGKQEDYSRFDLLKMCLDEGADLSMTTEDGWTALHAAVANAYTGWRGVEAHSLDRIKILLDRGLDVNARDIHGRTVLHTAALQGYFNFKNNLPKVFPDVVDILLASGADANVKDNEGHTALFYAQKMAYDKIVLSLERNEADKEIADIEMGLVTEQDTGSDAIPSLGPELLKAAWDGNIEKVKNLLSQGADTGYIDSDGFTAQARAKDNGHDEIVMLLEEASR
jgi:hypothetical protein